MAEKYEPSSEEVSKAEEMMTPEQEKLSGERYEKFLGEFRAFLEGGIKKMRTMIELAKEEERRKIAATHLAWSEEEVEQEMERRRKKFDEENKKFAEEFEGDLLRKALAEEEKKLENINFEK